MLDSSLLQSLPEVRLFPLDIVCRSHLSERNLLYCFHHVDMCPPSATLGVNFTSPSCPSFFSTFLASPQFKACYPLSLLLETSSRFFTALRDPITTLPPVMDRVCSTDVDVCSGVMDEVARDIQAASACGRDLQLGQPQAKAALDGLKSFRLYREAGCLLVQSTQNAAKSGNSSTPQTARYCLAQAAMSSNPGCATSTCFGVTYTYIPSAATCISTICPAGRHSPQAHSRRAMTARSGS